MTTAKSISRMVSSEGICVSNGIGRCGQVHSGTGADLAETAAANGKPQPEREGHGWGPGKRPFRRGSVTKEPLGL
jgi:hypothetical protein